MITCIANPRTCHSVDSPCWKGVAVCTRPSMNAVLLQTNTVTVLNLGGGTPILEDGGELPLYWPPFFLTFSDPIGSLFYVQLDLIDPLFQQKKIGWSLSHLVPEIIWPKVGLFFTNICHLTLLKQFVQIFSLIFDLVDSLFHCY